MVDVDGVVPLPWLEEPLRRGLAANGHALLVQGPQGIGQFDLATTLAQGWLCESAGARRPCGRCAACQLVRAQSHPDLLVLVPEALREDLGWATGGTGEEGGADKAAKAKPSKEVKVDAVRAAVAFAQTTSARGRGKVVVVHPAEAMNVIAANTLLKTLEEPAGAARFLLSCSAPDTLLPTIRSRCHALPLRVPGTQEAETWLAGQGVADPRTMLAAAGGQPLTARQWTEEGIDAKAWQRVPEWIVQGETAPFAAWPAPRLIETLQKLCHDAMSVGAGAPPRYFPIGKVLPGSQLDDLTRWSRELARIAEEQHHPWAAGLLVDALVASARSAYAPTTRGGANRRSDSLHSRP